MPLLQTKNLRKHFGDIHAVDGVDLVVNEGEFVSLIGSNGAGKTTLVNLVSAFLRPDAGEIFFRDQNINLWSSTERVKFGIVRSFQLVSLFDSFTALENVALAIFSRDGKSIRLASLAAVPGVVLVAAAAPAIRDLLLKVPALRGQVPAVTLAALATIPLATVVWQAGTRSTMLDHFFRPADPTQDPTAGRPEPSEPPLRPIAGIVSNSVDGPFQHCGGLVVFGDIDEDRCLERMRVAERIVDLCGPLECFECFAVALEIAQCLRQLDANGQPHLVWNERLRRLQSLGGIVESPARNEQLAPQGERAAVLGEQASLCSSSLSASSDLPALVSASMNASNASSFSRAAREARR